jgi:hypothetical protein
MSVNLIAASRRVSLARLAESYGKKDQVEEGRVELAKASTMVHSHGERWWTAELYRLKGELILPKSLELRATTSLARLWQHQGKTTETHQLLSAICGWFAEGLDTKDLHEAKVLLETLEADV